MLKTIARMLILAILAPSPALAQIPPSGPVSAPRTGPQTSGISVSGSSMTRVPATQARIALQFATANRSMTLDAQALKPIVDALVARGVDPSNIALPVNFAAPGGSNYATVTVTIAHPTIAMMRDGIVSLGTTIADMKNLILNSAQVFLTATDCAATIASTREHAIENARAKATAIARDLGVHVGPVISISAFDQGAADGSCNTQYYLGGGFNPQGPQTPDDYVTVAVFANVSITYAIK
jgi:uncharacterized protein YggE